MTTGFHYVYSIICLVGFFLFPIHVNAEEAPKPVFPESVVVINAGEYTAVSVKASPNHRSQTLGKIYGSLTAVEVLSPGKEFTLIKGKDYNTKKTIQGYVPTRSLKTVKPRTDWGILVDLSKQKGYVYKDGKLEKSFLVSTGIASRGWRTPTGTYLIGSRGRSFTTDTGVGAWNWVRFNKGYMFHSIIFDRKGNIIQSEANKLGREASHGCIRMPLDISVWFYQNIPKNTPVLIVESFKVPLEIPVNLVINNQKQDYTNPPLLVNGKVLAPMREIFEALGAQVQWNSKDNTIVATRDGNIITLVLNSQKALINQNEIELSDPPRIIKGKTMVPARFIAESLGVTVNWDNETKTVVIN